MTSRAVLVVCALLSSGCTRTGEAPSSEVIVTTAGDEMVLIPGGTFTMGSEDGEADERPSHQVTVDAFLMDRFEVTQAMLRRLEISNPSHFKGDDLPVDNVTWVFAVKLCNLRSEAEGLEPCYDERDATCDYTRSGYRLPTEAEWEYACRAGSGAAYGFGSDPRQLDRHGWYADNAAKKTHPVGKKKPNHWGLHDLHGNVAEWCNDPYDPRYYERSPATNPRGPEDAEMYIVRGGSWKSRAPGLRSAARGTDRPGFGDACLAPDTLGLRCVWKAPAAR